MLLSSLVVVVGADDDSVAGVVAAVAAVVDDASSFDSLSPLLPSVLVPLYFFSSRYCHYCHGMACKQSDEGV